MRRIVVLGSLNVDLVITVERLPRAGETLAGGDLAVFEGGKAANQACAATSGIGISDRPTGSACISVLPDGENAIVISPGANATLSGEIALEKLRAAAPYNFLLGQLETPITTIVAAFAEAKRSGATTILDPAPVQPLPAELIPYLDFITPNQIEAAALLGHEQERIHNFEDARAASESLLRAGYRSVVLKLGHLGCYVAAGTLSTAVPAFEVGAIDTTAAGDTFNAALRSHWPREPRSWKQRYSRMPRRPYPSRGRAPKTPSRRAPK